MAHFPTPASKHHDFPVPESHKIQLIPCDIVTPRLRIGIRLGRIVTVIGTPSQASDRPVAGGQPNLANSITPCQLKQAINFWQGSQAWQHASDSFRSSSGRRPRLPAAAAPPEPPPVPVGVQLTTDRHAGRTLLAKFQALWIPPRRSPGVRAHSLPVRRSARTVFPPRRGLVRRRRLLLLLLLVRRGEEPPVVHTERPQYGSEGDGAMLQRGVTCARDSGAAACSAELQGLIEVDDDVGARVGEANDCEMDSECVSGALLKLGDVLHPIDDPTRRSDTVDFWGVRRADFDIRRDIPRWHLDRIVQPFGVVALRIILPVKLGTVSITNVFIISEYLDNDTLVSCRVSPALLSKFRPTPNQIPLNFK